MEQLVFENLKWRDVRDPVRAVNPKLAAIIDQLDPSDDYTFIKVKYPYGANILDRKTLNLPAPNGDIVSLHHHQISHTIRNQLAYSTCPLGLILNKATEVYVETPEERIIPFKIFNPGVILGVWEIMNGHKAISISRNWDWCISSGARSLFMLPKITDVASHSRLKRDYKLRSHLPNGLFDHWKIFKEIYDRGAQQTPWHTEILFFTKKWLEKREDSLGWVRLYDHWVKQAWDQSLNWKNKVFFDYSWQLFTMKLAKRKLKPKPYLLDTLRHLVSIGTGVIPGFRPIDDRQLVAPTLAIQEAYVKSYGLKTYTPLIMHPCHLTLESSATAVYYSLQYPTLPEQPTALWNSPSVMKELRALKELIEIYREILIDKLYSLPKTVKYYDFVDCIQYNYFHTEIDKFNEIKLTSELLMADPALNFNAQEYGHRKFAENSHFLKGCVRISIDPHKIT